MKTAELTRNSSDNVKSRVVNLDREGIRRQWHPSAERVGTEDLTVTRQDIRFETVAPGRVLIEVTIRNRGDISSKPTQAVLRSAPLGAFLPWTPLIEVGVPSILPGGEHVVKVNARYGSGEQTLRADDIALAAGSIPIVIPGNAGQVAAQSLAQSPVRARRSWGLASLVASSTPGLTGSDNWIGNVDIHVRGAYSEKHCAAGRLAYGGVSNMAYFLVGDHKPDWYDFKPFVRGTDRSDDWAVKLTRIEGGDLSLPMSHSWVLLQFTPIAGADNATLEVDVTRHSTGETAVVEFEVATR